MTGGAGTKKRGRPRIEPGKGGCNVLGYKLIYVKGHPLAMSLGRIYEHRYVLYEAIGEGPHPCHWCGTLLDWGRELHVDHLDDDRLNNDLGNLVVSCRQCNRDRQRQPHTVLSDDWVTVERWPPAWDESSA